jgi:mannose-6-phosphate isomerase-like protein (cupin superfamily)
MPWQTTHVPVNFDLLAPDGSEIRLLTRVNGGSMVHCVVRPGQVTEAVRHQTVEELWYCLAGQGELWRRSNQREEVVQLKAGVAASIPLGVDFQFRANGGQPLELVITTMPPWPGPSEAVPVAGAWQPVPARGPSG